MLYRLAYPDFPQKNVSKLGCSLSLNPPNPPTRHFFEILCIRIRFLIILDFLTPFKTVGSQAALSVAILITDGRPTDEHVTPPEQMATFAKMKNIRIYTIGIGDHINQTQQGFRITEKVVRVHSGCRKISNFF